MRRVLTVLSVSLGMAMGAAAGVGAEEGPPSLPPQLLVTEPERHRAPSPFPLLPLFTVELPPGFMPFRRDHVPADAGAVESVVGAQRPFRVGGGLSAHGRETYGQATVAGARGVFTAGVVGTRAEEYEDGDGETTRFGYDRITGQVGLVLPLREGRSLRTAFVFDDIEDIELPIGVPVVRSGVPVVSGFGADPVETRRAVGRVIYDDTSGTLSSARLHAELGYVDLARRADNFSLRPTLPANRMRSRLDAGRLDGTVYGDVHWGPMTHRFGVSGMRDARDGQRSGGPGMGDLSVVSGCQFPDAVATRGGLFWEGGVRPWTSAVLRAGAVLDYWTADAHGADDPFRIGPFSGTPRALYALYYGNARDIRREEVGAGGRLALEQAFAGERVRGVVSIGRQVRFPDLMELYFALPSAPATDVPAGTPSRQVGNPFLSPEVHHRAEAELTVRGDAWHGYGRPPAAGGRPSSGTWRFSARGFVDYVEDFISRDRAHGQDGILQHDNASVWRNVDALLAGAEVDAQWNLTRNLSARANAAWTYGQNRSDDRPLYGIAPLEANLALDWHDWLGSFGTWSAGTKLRLVASQSRADDDPATGSGYDAAETAGFALLDVHAGAQLYDRFGVRVGVDNVFDKTYAEHVPFITTDDASPSRVNGPGRFVWVRAVANF